jgi:hypothetical protein
MKKSSLNLLFLITFLFLGVLLHAANKNKKLFKATTPSVTKINQEKDILIIPGALL